MNPTDLSAARWRKSSRSDGQAECVEVADLDGGQHAVRDSKHPTGPALVVTTAQWATFTAAVSHNEFTVSNNEFN